MNRVLSEQKFFHESNLTNKLNTTIDYVIRKSDQKLYVCKRVKMSKETKGMIANEMEILSSISHPNVIKSKWSVKYL